LLSVRRQTYDNLEIIVVNDGSSDNTDEIVARHAAQDSRIRVVHQPNQGLAAARNSGIAAARAEIVAPVDADDLWHPAKIALQVAALQAADARVGLVYTWSVHVDDKGRIAALGRRSFEVGDVLRDLCQHLSIVGNGSAALMLKSAVLSAGGYDTRLRAQGGQGCEDFKLYFSIAERYHFSVVPQYLTGYRQLPNSMSSDTLQMARSWELVCAEILNRRPELADVLKIGTFRLLAWLRTRARVSNRYSDARTLAWRLVCNDAAAALRLLVLHRARDAVLRRVQRPRFDEGDGIGKFFGDALL
jgi:glycosyltransferase involved in cell wall biosynthesis